MNAPPARGNMVLSSATHRARHSVTSPPITHTSAIVPTEPVASATLEGARKMPLPTMSPTVTAIVDRSDNRRGSSVGASAGVSAVNSDGCAGATLTLELPGDGAEHLTPCAIGASGRSRAASGVDLVEDVGAIDRNAPLR